MISLVLVICLVFLCMPMIQNYSVTLIMCAAKTKLILSLITFLIGWTCSNKLSLKVSKTKFACVHTKQKIVVYPDIKINTISIDEVSEFNFLGLIKSSNLKWRKHIDHIGLKISKVIGIMYRLRPTLPEDILLTIYNSLIMPHFNYCHLVWGCNIHETHKLYTFHRKKFFELLLIVILLLILNHCAKGCEL